MTVKTRDELAPMSQLARSVLSALLQNGKLAEDVRASTEELGKIVDDAITYEIARTIGRVYAPDYAKGIMDAAEAREAGYQMHIRGMSTDVQMLRHMLWCLVDRMGDAGSVALYETDLRAHRPQDCKLTLREDPENRRIHIEARLKQEDEYDTAPRDTAPDVPDPVAGPVGRGGNDTPATPGD
jgi:hypothetical protein